MTPQRRAACARGREANTRRMIERREEALRFYTRYKMWSVRQIARRMEMSARQVQRYIDWGVKNGRIEPRS